MESERQWTNERTGAAEKNSKVENSAYESSDFSAKRLHYHRFFISSRLFSSCSSASFVCCMFFPHSLRRCSCHRLFIDIVVVVVVLIGNPFAGSEIEPCHSMYRFFSRSHSIFFNLSHCSFLLLVCHSILFMVWHIRSNFIPSAISVWNSFFLPRVSIDR